MPLSSTATQDVSILKIYTGPCILMGAFIVWLTWVSAGVHPPADAKSLLSPMGGLFSLIVVVWVLMVAVRNGSIIFGHISLDYFADYHAKNLTNDLIERPARVFNNLMQVPQYFYIICILMILFENVDALQLTLAWAFVVLRTVHCIIYLALNWVPYRFASWALSCITLCILWYRFFDQMVLVF